MGGELRGASTAAGSAFEGEESVLRDGEEKAVQVRRQRRSGFRD